MLPKSVAPRFVFFTSIVVMGLLLITLMPLEWALRQRLGLRPDPYAGPYSVPISVIASLFLVPRVLSSLGVRVRGRSVERLQAAGRDREDDSTGELPIRIYHGRLLVGVLPIVLSAGGLACLVLAVCLAFLWFPPPRARDDATVFMIALLGMSVILIGGAFLVRRRKPELLCEISEKGIRAPDGLWGRETFVAWEDLARCEIIRDDERIWYDHFVLWDRAGRRRFRSCKDWLGRIRRSDRDRIIRALGSRFPQKEKAHPKAEPVLAHQTSAAVWDRDLDG
jgi:hypothetical protein